MGNFVADGADEEPLPLLAGVALLAEHAVVAAPVVLELLAVALGEGQAVRVEALAAEVAAEEVFFVAKRSAQIAHFLEDQGRVSEADLDRIGVPASVALIVSLQILHQLLPLLVGGKLALFRHGLLQVAWSKVALQKDQVA